MDRARQSGVTPYDLPDKIRWKNLEWYVLHIQPSPVPGVARVFLPRCTFARVPGTGCFCLCLIRNPIRRGRPDFYAQFAHGPSEPSRLKLVITRIISGCSLDIVMVILLKLWKNRKFLLSGQLICKVRHPCPNFDFLEQNYYAII